MPSINPINAMNISIEAMARLRIFIERILMRFLSLLTRYVIVNHQPIAPAKIEI